MYQTRDKIIRACEELAIRRGRGFYSLSLDELAQEAGVSKRTIYRYFNNKEEIIEAAIEKIIDTIAAKNMDLIDNEKDIKKIALGILKNASYLVNQQVIADIRLYYPALWHKIDQLRRTKIQVLFSQLFANSSEKMRWRVDPQIFRDAFLAAMTVILTPGYIMESGRSFEAVGSDFLDLFLFGGVEKAEKD